MNEFDLERFIDQNGLGEMLDRLPPNPLGRSIPGSGGKQDAGQGAGQPPRKGLARKQFQCLLDMAWEATLSSMPPSVRHDADPTYAERPLIEGFKHDLAILREEGAPERSADEVLHDKHVYALGYIDAMMAAAVMLGQMGLSKTEALAALHRHWEALVSGWVQDGVDGHDYKGRPLLHGGLWVEDASYYRAQDDDFERNRDSGDEHKDRGDQTNG